MTFSPGYRARTTITKLKVEPSVPGHRAGIKEGPLVPVGNTLYVVVGNSFGFGSIFFMRFNKFLNALSNIQFFTFYCSNSSVVSSFFVSLRPSGIATFYDPQACAQT